MSAFQVNGSPLAYIASSLRERTSTVHPHACGEHLPSGYCSSSASGSSPRMWGTLSCGKTATYVNRFIPTHVGNTRRHRRSGSATTVHLHACGEHKRGFFYRSAPHGSSPRMWGTQVDYLLHQRADRFIPTHVGNTCAACAGSSSKPVHPHACGEHRKTYIQFPSASGSSPRMWGTHRRALLAFAFSRFIPTHVGNTDAGRRTSGGFPVHPHACGEHWAPRCLVAWPAGSSPRMWGTRTDLGL